MAIELFFSNQLEYLAEKLAAAGEADQDRCADPFLPLKIIVPNNNLSKWLTLTMARRNTIAMNIDFQFLETGLWQMVAALDPDADETRMRDKTHARLMILAVLVQLTGDDPVMAPVTGYLRRPDGTAHPDYSLRLWQLSEKLATLFQEYEYHRTDMIHDWIGQTGAGKTGRFSETDPLVQCEKQLYRAVRRLDARRDRTGIPVLSLMAYADQVLGAPHARPRRPDPGPENGGAVHFFGLSQVSAFHLSLIDRLKAFYDIYIYALNPSREFWEDLQTPAEKRWVARKNRGLRLHAGEISEGELLGNPGHPLLAAWGKPGRESIRLLCRLTDYAFNAGFSPVGPARTLLARVQNDILTLDSGDGPDRMNQDRSLQIVGCPGIFREVETVYANILFNLASDDTLQLTDIAVLAPDISAYKPVFAAVFNRAPRRLSYNLIDSRADIESVYGQAVLGLLALATSRFTRKNVFDLLLNPCVADRWGLSTDDTHLWAAWADALNIFHTYETSARPGPDAPASGRYTWQQGLQRLRLARIFSTDADTGGESRHFENLVPYADMDTGDTPQVEKFCLAVTALARAAKMLRLNRAPADAWRRALVSVTSELLSIPDACPGEAVVRQNLFEALTDLTFFDQLQPEDAPPRLDASLVAAYIRFRLGAISGGSGDYLTHGVTIAELRPMRPIPFRIIYLLGMEEGRFPGRADTSPLDLRLKKRRIGDVSSSERNRYLFLETLLSAREKMYISYVSRDLQKDRVLSPCNVVTQLRRYIEEAVLPPDMDFQIPAVPLKGSSPRYLDPDAVTPVSDVLVNFDLTDRVTCYRAAGCWEDVWAQLSDNDRQRVARLNPDFSVSAGPAAAAGEGDPLQLGRLKRFLLSPVDESTRRHLGLFEETAGLEDRIQAEDEPFFSEYPLDWRFFYLPLAQWLNMVIAGIGGGAPPSLDHIFGQFYTDLYRCSATPEEPFARADRAVIRQKLLAVEQRMAPVIERMTSARQVWAAVVAGAPDDVSIAAPRRILRLDPAELFLQDGQIPGQARRIQISGQLRWLWYEKDTGWHVLVPATGRPPARRPDKSLLDPGLFYLVSRAAPLKEGIGDAPLTMHVVGEKKISGFIFDIGREDAEKYISGLIADYLDPHHRLWLPFEFARKCAVDPLSLDPAAIDNTLRHRFRDDMLAAFADDAGTFDRLIQPVFPDDLLDRAVRRFGIFGRLQPETV